MRAFGCFNKAVMFSASVIISLLIIFSFPASLSLAAEGENSDADTPEDFIIDKTKVPSDSPFLNPEPRIDEEAASVVKEEESQPKSKTEMQKVAQKIPPCSSLPEGLWVFLLGAYLFLILFNLSYGFEKDNRLRWFWESLYTILALIAWDRFDGCRENSWFAPTVIEVGIIIYAFYLYYFKKKLAELSKTESKETEKTSPLPFE
ncbi:MAG: hypothetical protein NT136_04115 [Candidatus Moranbacteria bacterium]|nr:hypothetical protein [Candidatus Moranbacteria bacterium]